MTRMIYHRPDARLSVGVEVDDEKNVYATVAACHPRDQFEKKKANLIINGRLDGKNLTTPISRKNGGPQTPAVVLIGQLSTEKTKEEAPAKSTWKKSKGKVKKSAKTVKPKAKPPSLVKTVFGPIRDVIRQLHSKRDINSVMNKLLKVL